MGCFGFINLHLVFAAKGISPSACIQAGTCLACRVIQHNGLGSGQRPWLRSLQAAAPTSGADLPTTLHQCTCAWQYDIVLCLPNIKRNQIPTYLCLGVPVCAACACLACSKCGCGVPMGKCCRACYQARGCGSYRQDFPSGCQWRTCSNMLVYGAPVEGGQVWTMACVPVAGAAGIGRLLMVSSTQAVECAEGCWVGWQESGVQAGWS